MLERPSSRETAHHHDHGVKIDGVWHRDWYAAFEDQRFAEWLRAHNVRVPMFEHGYGIYCILVREPLHRYPEMRLPIGHWYKGGCARELFFARLGVPCPKARDIDIIRDENIVTESPEHHPLLKLADHVDYFGGYTKTDEEEVEPNEETFEKYFFSRDFTINEVLANDARIYFTKEALVDTLNRLIRPTSDQRWSGKSDPLIAVKTFAKALRLETSLLLADLKNPRDWTIDPRVTEGITQKILEQYPFYIFLHLDRALKDGLGRGEAYLSRWQELGFFRDCESIEAFADRLFPGVRGPFKPTSPLLEDDYVKR